MKPAWTDYFLATAKLISSRSHDIHTKHERNALSNCVIRPDNGIAYITGQPCNDCIMALWQEGITEVHIIDGHGTKLFDQEAKKRFDLFVKQTGMKVFKHTPNFSWVKEISWD